jgi:hypothetical protein
MNNISPYDTHRWNSRQRGGSPDDANSAEMICACEECGCENMGDPAEFPDLDYPICMASENE